MNNNQTNLNKASIVYREGGDHLSHLHIDLLVYFKM